MGSPDPYTLGASSRLLPMSRTDHRLGENMKKTTPGCMTEKVGDEGDIFLDSVRESGDLAGVLECDGDTCYFYLYQLGRSARVLNHVYVCGGAAPFVEEELRIVWSDDEGAVALCVGGVVWAAFDGGKAFGGQYTRLGRPSVPQTLVDRFVVK